MKIVFLVATAVLLTACNTAPYVVKEGGTSDELARDRFDCKQKVATMYGGYGQMGPGGAMFAADDYHDCMRSRGYSQARPAPSQPTAATTSNPQTARP
jgi:hypothetical protein